MEEASREFPTKTRFVLPDEDKADSRSEKAVILDCEVPAAAQWLTIAAYSIWKWMTAGERRESEEDDSDLWKGK